MRKQEDSVLDDLQDSINDYEFLKEKHKKKRKNMEKDKEKRYHKLHGYDEDY
jgi:hypothetical protein